MSGTASPTSPIRPSIAQFSAAHRPLSTQAVRKRLVARWLPAMSVCGAERSSPQCQLLWWLERRGCVLSALRTVEPR